jgi:TolA-binding protein
VVNAWFSAKNGLKNEALERRRRLTPTEDEAAKLVEWAVLDQSSRGIGSVKVLVPFTAAVSFALAFWLGMYWTDTESAALQYEAATQNNDENATSSPVQSSLEKQDTQLEYETDVSGHTVGRLGSDRFGLAPSSKLTVLSNAGKDTVLRLEKGQACFDVSPREDGERFIVESGAYRVLVVGTRFSVNARKDEVRVAVVEGIVEVAEKGGRGWRLVAGEALSVKVNGKAERSEGNGGEATAMAKLLGERPFEQVSVNDTSQNQAEMTFDDLRAKRPIRRKRLGRRHRRSKALPLREDVTETIYLETNTPEDANTAEEKVKNDLPLNQEPVREGVDLWRQWVLSGRLEAAEAALVAHLENNPVDTDAYSLLADCRRKAGKYAEAVETYKKLTAIAGEYQANRARFKAGVLMQENLKNHLAAAAIFDEYLATGKGTPLLRAKATVRLARSLIRLGEIDRARILLRRVIDGYSGSSVAIQAREILNDID